jgi:hypothetical protein
MRWAKMGDSDVSSKRPCYKLKTYVDAAMVLKERYGASTILLSTESQDVIDELVHYPQFKVRGFPNVRKVNLIFTTPDWLLLLAALIQLLTGFCCFCPFGS